MKKTLSQQLKSACRARKDFILGSLENMPKWLPNYEKNIRGCFKMYNNHLIGRKNIRNIVENVSLSLLRIGYDPLHLT